MPILRSLAVAAGLVLCAGTAHLHAEVGERAVTRAFLTVVVGEDGDKADAIDLIDSTWEPAYLSMALDAVRLTRDPTVSGTLLQMMERRYGGGHGYDLGAWQRAMWNAPEARHPRYAAFKGALYSAIDPRFAAYFDAVGEPLIRLDEIVWGGVRQDGIPPLRNPAMLGAEGRRLPRRRAHRVRASRSTATRAPIRNASSPGTRCSSTRSAASRSPACTARSAAPSSSIAPSTTE